MVGCRYELGHRSPGLIGLLSHDLPVAYVSEHLPHLEELGSYATRQLSDVKTSALQQLRRENDFVLDDRLGRIQMIGSQRASDQCRKRHTVQNGELPGALSYELQSE